jgi:hypothetical protein
MNAIQRYITRYSLTGSDARWREIITKMGLIDDISGDASTAFLEGLDCLYANPKEVHTFLEHMDTRAHEVPCYSVEWQVLRGFEFCRLRGSYMLIRDDMMDMPLDVMANLSRCKGIIAPDFHVMKLLAEGHLKRLLDISKYAREVFRFLHPECDKIVVSAGSDTSVDEVVEVLCRLNHLCQVRLSDAIIANPAMVNEIKRRSAMISCSIRS